MLQLPVSVRAWPMNHRAEAATEGPVRFHIRPSQLEGFLRTWEGGFGCATLYQPDTAHSNLTRMALFIYRDAPPGHKYLVPESMSAGLVWRPISLHLKTHKGKPAGLRWTVRRRFGKQLEHPLPIGLWEGILTLNDKEDSTQALLEMQACTQLFENASPISEPESKSNLVLPGDPEFERASRDLPKIEVPR